MTYHWQPAQPIRVEVDALGAPRRIWWRGRGHPVEEVLNRWRVDEGWWRLGVEDGRVWREYFKLVTRSGLLLLLYRDLAGGGWYLQGLYD